MKKLLIVLIALGAGLAGLAFWINQSASHRTGNVEYTHASAEYGSLSETVSATGLLQPEDVIVVGSSLPGRVVQIGADFNQSVRAGDVLLRLDNRMAQQDLRDAEVGVRLAKTAVTLAVARRDAAKHALERQRQLAEGVGRKLDIEAAEETYQAAEAGVQAAQVQVDKAEEARRRADLGLSLTTIRVPHVVRPAESSALGLVLEPDLAGALSTALGLWYGKTREYLVLDRKIEVDQQIAPPLSGQLFVLAGDLARMRIKAQVSEGDVSKVRKGLAADFTITTYSDEDLHFHGQVSEVRLQPSTVQGAIYYDTLIDVANQRDPATKLWRLRPGMTASVDIIQRKHNNVWKMPTAALTFQLDEHYWTPAARAKLAAWQERSDAHLWRSVWTQDNSGQPWPLFVRVAGTDAQGEAPIRDAQFQQVLQWDPDVADKLSPGVSATYPQVIVGAPPVNGGGLFHAPSIRF